MRAVQRRVLISIAAIIVTLAGACDDTLVPRNPFWPEKEKKSNGPPPLVIEMIWIEPGTFMMGSPGGEPGRYSPNETQHSVTLSKGFYMGKYPVTQGQWIAVMGTNPSYFRVPAASETNTVNRPVEQVNWYNTLVFCNRLSIMEGLTPAYNIDGSTNPSDWGAIPTSTNAIWNAATIVTDSTGYRLPTEAQWEYACRAGTTTGFNWGTNYINYTQANYNASYTDACNATVGTSLERTTTVGNYEPNAWRLYDMHGNVWEWCWDWYDANYGGVAGTAATDPTGAAGGTYRVVRGVSWHDFGRYARSAFRCYNYSPYEQSDILGFRLLRP